MRRSWRMGLGLMVTGAGVAFACGGDGRDFGAQPGTPQGGEAGSPEMPNPSGMSGSAGSSALGQGGDAAGTAGDAQVGPTEAGGASGARATGLGGAGGATSTPTPDCPAGYSDWLSSSFSFPDGDLIGTTDFPPMPWAQTGALKIDTGKLSGTGTAIVSQGAAFPYAGSRLRFRARFTDSKQQVTAAFDAAKDGTGGVRVTLDAAGSLTLTEGAKAVGTTDVPPLESGVDWFVEATFKGASASVLLSRDNYASEKSATLTKSLATDALKVTAAGVKTVAVLASAAGIAPSLDELSVARCGVTPPDLTPQLVDTFERADSTTVGHAEFPASSIWVTSGNTERIVGGALETEGLKTTTIPLKVPTDGLRIRTTVRMADGASPGLWADVNYNDAAGQNGPPGNGFWVWASPGDGKFYTTIFGGAQEMSHPVKFTPGVAYFVELDRDGGVAVLTVRSQSYAGPILGTHSGTGLLPATGDHFTVGDAGGGGTLFDEIRVESYLVP